MQAMGLRNQGDKGGTGDDASVNENTGTTASPWLSLLSPHQLHADVSAGLRKRHGDRGACFSAWERERALRASILGWPARTNLLELDSSSSVWLPAAPSPLLLAPLAPPGALALLWHTKIRPWLLYGSSRMLILTFWQCLSHFTGTVPTIHN